jgi:hypothetical protein
LSVNAARSCGFSRHESAAHATAPIPVAKKALREKDEFEGMMIA